MVKKKKWTVLFYLMAEPPPGVLLPVTPGQYAQIINAKVQCVVAAVTAAALAHDVHAAIRVVWDQGASNGNGGIQATVAGTVPLTLRSTSQFFIPKQPRHLGPLVDDMAGFYEWALPQCPADHHAVFFWGHSFGPAGLFRVGSPIVMPSLSGGSSTSGGHAVRVGQVSLADLLRTAPLNIHGLHDALRRFPKKVDLVVFQDCWMSTLETAYQLRDVVVSMIGSQSKVPIGVQPCRHNQCARTWDYHTIFGDLDQPKQIVTDLYHFYTGHLPNMWPNPSVPFAALNLEAVDALTEPLNVIVDKLTSSSPTLSTFTAATDPYITHVDANGNLDAGSDALADVARLLRGIELSWPTSDHRMLDAIHRAQKALGRLVLISTEAHSTPAPLGFHGVSVVGGAKQLKRPAAPAPPAASAASATLAPATDGILTVLLQNTSYQNLEFSKQTRWNDLVL